ncbi:ATP-dependent DNA helicase recG [Candidatus Glomeribacter gigasporarum BEG34]|uniref:ATP-dependent DNA helicase RecG n=1 Tax=Candidatus Glomeribacter gigasporarum BEG34 TaxID=1070319 RepID=G2J9G0_9BURK|nr:ATP-dependent DNA helicase RecG [Candidatus Glomeribacter gigasporarum]CCD29407.1 ATP-dependent DNA helicase recG [Candidatus Glomeribacter gigasporarum BEG34]
MNRTDQFTCPVSHDGRAPAVQNSRSFPIRNKTAPSAARLAKLGLARAFDFVLHLPLRYEDETALTPIRAAQPGIAAQIEGIVSASEITLKPRRQWCLTLVDRRGDTAQLRFFHFYSAQVKQFEAGVRLRALGEIRKAFSGPEMVHPTMRIITENTPLPNTLTPVYPASQGVGQAWLRRAIDQALADTPLPEILPETLQAEIIVPLRLPSLADAVAFLHRPDANADTGALAERTHPAWLRIKFEELLAQQLSLKRAHLARRQIRAPRMPRATHADTLSSRIERALPFALTRAQQRVRDEISADLAAPYPMQRLLQGDVGSGKTVIAALAAAQAIEAGYQVALMAPTELLAEQHLRQLRGWFEPCGAPPVWLAGRLKDSEKRAALRAIATGAARFVIGTHAMIQSAVEFMQLGLAIIDEQHRFGVEQRLALRAKAQRGGKVSNEQPHQLMMSATPIPRSLAMSYYADLDISALDELPPGRTLVLTRLISHARRDEVIARIRAAARARRQIYWVCPLIEESEALQLQTALDTFAALCAALPKLRIGLIHGRLKPAEKTIVMEQFMRNEIQLLVATTVIEVGVDVPNASLMIIEHAERFGLAQLHQLRGRVGRGHQTSVCLLLYAPPLSRAAYARLRTMREIQDGFEIAQRDLEIRGPGEFLGARQSGAAMLRFADIRRDACLIQPARRAAERLLHAWPEQAEQQLDRWLGRRAHYLKV